MKREECPTCRLVQCADIIAHQFIVVRDAHRQTHAVHANPEQHPRDTVRTLCEDVIIIDDGETVEWGVAIASDEGAARISPHVQWLGRFTFDSERNT